MYRLAITTFLLGIGAAGATELPLFFEPNQGQAPKPVEFISRANGVASYLTAKEAQLQVGNSFIRMELVGASKTAGEGLDRLPGLSSYFLGRTARDWHTRIPQFDRVRYRDVYPGIDLVYYGNRGKLEYDFVLGPSADPARIRVGYSGLKSLRIDKDGNLLLVTQSGEIRQRRPVVYQEIDGKRTEIAASYRLAGRGEVRIDVGAYDARRRLTVDPVLEYGTFIGANSSSGVWGVKVDASGNVYLGGYIWAQPFSPTSANSAGTAMVVKFSPSKNQILYWAALTPDGQIQTHGIDIDAAGNAYLAGVTSSEQLPLVNAFQSTMPPAAYGGQPSVGFVSKLAPDGQSLVYSTYLGGSHYEYLRGIAVDKSGNAFVTGQTLSPDFPVVNAMQPKATFSLSNAVLAKFSPTGTVLFSTFFGGSSCEAASAIAVDSNGYPVIVGMAQSSDFPFKNAVQTQIVTEAAFAAKFTPDGQSLVFATALGGSWSAGGSLALDAANNIWVSGSADPAGSLLLKNPLQSQKTRTFLSKLSADGSQLLYQSYFGGSVEEDIASPQGMAVDSGGNLYIAGRTFSPDFPVKNSLIQFKTKPLSPTSSQQGAYGFVTELSADGQSLLYSTLFGGYEYQDQALALALDSAGAAWVSGSTFSSDFPVTANTYQSTLNGSGAQTVFLVKMTGGGSQTGTSPISLTSTPQILDFTAVTGSSQPAQLTIGVGASNGAATPFTASAATSSGGSWLSIGAAGGTTPAQLTVTANPTGLSAGSYSGTIHLAAANANPVDIAVWLTVSAPVSTLVTSAPNLTFQSSGQQVVYVSTSNGNPASVALSAVTSSGGNWLSVSPASLTTPAPFTVTANSSGLAQGVYSGTVRLAPASGVALNLAVTLIVPQQSYLAASPSGLTFQVAAGSSSPHSQSLTVTSTGSAVSFGASVSGGSWLAVNPSSGTTPGNVAVSIASNSLTAGSYNATILVSGGGSTITVPVTVQVTAALSPAVLTLLSPSSVPVNAVQPLVTLKGSGFVAGSSVYLSTTDTNQALATTFIDASTLQISLTSATLSQGSALNLTVVNPGAAPSNAMTLTVTAAAPQISGKTVMNGASMVSGPVAPGEIVSIAGTFLGPAQGAPAVPDAAGTFPTEVAGVQVLFDGHPAPILYASASQVNAIVPFGLAGAQATALQVEYRNVLSAAVSLPVAASAPALFTANSSGSGQGAILNADMSLNQPGNPVAPGSVVVLYATGAGQMKQPLTDGQTVTQLVAPLAAVTVTIGGQDAQVIYAGSAPTEVAGMLQVNVVVPATTPAGPAIPIVLNVGDTASQPGVTLAIQ